MSINIDNNKKNFIISDTKKESIENIKNSLDSNDLIFIGKLLNLKNNLCYENLNLKSIQQQIKEITNFNKAQNYEYLQNLICPEKARGSKIPSQVPIPSCSFQLHNCTTIKTNNSGNCAVFLNPFFLACNDVIGAKIGNIWISRFLTSMWVNNDDTLTGSSDNNNWEPVSIEQTLPPVYDQYRLVSASLQVRYIGRLDYASGIIGGGIVYDESNTIGGYYQKSAYVPEAEGTASIAPTISKYGNFELIRDSFYHKENNILEGLRMLYFPLDNSYEEYVKIMDNKTINYIEPTEDTVNFEAVESYYKNGFNWVFYALNAPANSTCFKVDLYCNFECLPMAQFLNYMPISVNPLVLSSADKKRFILLVQQHPIFKLNEETEEIPVPDIFEKMLKKFHNGLPGFDKLKSWGLLQAAASLKPGIALAGNMMLSNYSSDYC